MATFSVVLLLLALNAPPGGNGAYGEWDYQRDLNSCATAMLAREANNGGLAMDRTGHGTVTDRILEECRRALGQEQNGVPAP